MHRYSKGIADGTADLDGMLDGIPAYAAWANVLAYEYEHMGRAGDKTAQAECIQAMLAIADFRSNPHARQAFSAQILDVKNMVLVLDLIRAGFCSDEFLADPDLGARAGKEIRLLMASGAIAPCIAMLLRRENHVSDMFTVGEIQGFAAHLAAGKDTSSLQRLCENLTFAGRARKLAACRQIADAADATPQLIAYLPVPSNDGLQGGFAPAKLSSVHIKTLVA